MSDTDAQFIRALIKRNRYLSLATCDGERPWIAPLEYISDEDLNLYFFSPEDADHCEQLAERCQVAVAIFDGVQPEYEPSPEMPIAGLQIAAEARKLIEPFPKLVDAQIEAWKLPMPPYAPFIIQPIRWFVPVLKDGANCRREVKVR
ncbi:pyridoxamine 5'-phosphate oxidase family protein [Sphingomicrobium arenosum]|uniref:pyridoxamine 5'-phosphate oxidase family protein n=1 Tax=Sphingomicrobium arenosum TaxID=2233861 RepID=UPI00223F5AD1|nr:pyridoxamine 5'-phosphate oxidase family protein [Sphingomicrobium arenosum]